MQRLRELSKKITDLILKIQQEYPELYQYLDETPITISSDEHPQLNTQNFADYLDSLKQLLQHHIDNHHLNKASNGQ